MTTTAITASSAPIAKLYRMCRIDAHKACKGAFEQHSVCNCACHKAAKDVRAVWSKPKPAARKAPARQQHAVKAAPAKRYSEPTPKAEVYSKAEIDARIADLCKLVRSLRSLPVR